MSGGPISKSVLASLWDSALVPRELHAILKYKLTAPILDTSLDTLDAVEILSDFDFAYLCLAKFSPATTELILKLNREVRDSACVYYLFTYAMESIVDDPDLSVERKMAILQQFPHIVAPSPTSFSSTDQNTQVNEDLEHQHIIDQWKLEGVGSTDNERQFLQSFWKIISFFKNFIEQKYKEVIKIYVSKTSQLYVAVLSNTSSSSSLSSPSQSQSPALFQSNNIQEGDPMSNSNPINQQQQQQQNQQNQLTTTVSLSNQQQQPTQLQQYTQHRNFYTVDTIDQYNQHCILRSGLLFECIDQLFIQTGLTLQATQGVINTSLLASSSGIFIQKVNLIRNFRKNLFQNRTLWPAEIWSLYSQHLDWFTQHNDHIRSKLCLNHMILDALKHGLDAIQYLSLIQHHLPTFQFFAIQIITAYTILSSIFNHTQIFSSSFVLRSGLVCDIALNCENLSIAKGYIFETLSKIDHNLIDPELDPIYLQPTVTREETAKGVAQYQELTHYLNRSKQFCLGFDPISSGWSTVFKWIGITTSALVIFKYLTDYNSLWDDEIALRYPRGSGGINDLDRFRPKRGKPRYNGFAYQRADLQLDDYLPPEHQAQTLENIMRTGGNNVGHNRFLSELLSEEPTDQMGKLDAGMARAEAFLDQLQKRGPDSFSELDIQRELDSLQKMMGLDEGGRNNDDSFKFEDLQKLLGLTGAEKYAQTEYGKEYGFSDASLPVGYLRDQYLSDGKEFDKRKVEINPLHGGIAYPAFEDDLGEYDELDSFDKKGEANLERLLGMIGNDNVENIPDDKFFELVAGAMNHGAGKK